MRSIRLIGFFALLAGAYLSTDSRAQQPGDGSKQGLVFGADSKGKAYPLYRYPPGSDTADIYAAGSLDLITYPGKAGVNPTYPQIVFGNTPLLVKTEQLDAKGNPVAGTAVTYNGTKNQPIWEAATQQTTLKQPGNPAPQLVYSGYSPGTYRVTVSTEVKITYNPATYPNNNVETRDAVLVGTVVIYPPP